MSDNSTVGKQHATRPLDKTTGAKMEAHKAPSTNEVAAVSGVLTIFTGALRHSGEKAQEQGKKVDNEKRLMKELASDRPNSESVKKLTQLLLKGRSSDAH